LNASPSPSVPRRPAAPFPRRLAAIAAAGLLLRLAAIVWIPSQPVSDFWSYYHRGLNLAEYGRYDAILGRADANYPPLYPILLAGAFLLSPGHTLLAAKVVNCLLGVAAILLGALLTRRLWGDRAGTIAACFFAFFPRYLLLPCLLASENLFSPLLLLFVLLVLEGSRAPRALRLAAGAGLALALAALTRTVAYYLGALWLFGALGARKRWKAVLAETLLVLAVQHAAMLPWALRNEARLGRFTFLNTAGGYATFLGNNPKATGLWYEGREQLEKLAPGVLGKGELSISDASNTLAWRWIRENPGQALRLYFVKVGIIFTQADLIETFAVSGVGITPPVPGLDALPGPHFLKTRLSALKAVLSTAGWLIVILGLLGWILLGRRVLHTREPRDLTVALVFPAAALYVPLTSSLIAVNGRYRWPVEDLMIPVAAMLLAWLPDGLRAARRALLARRSRPPRDPRVFEAAVLLAAAGILCYQLFVPPVVGLADNGDFPRVMWPVGIFHKTEADAHYFRFLTLRYETGAPRRNGHFNSEIPIAAVARIPAAAALPHGVFDIRYLGALHALLLLGALALLLAGSRQWSAAARTIFAASLVFLFTDVGYAALLNSFYTSAATLLFLLLTAGIAACLASGPRSRKLQAGFWLAAFALVLSKPQETVLAPLLALLGLLLAREGRGPGRRRSAAWLGAALCLAAVLMYRTTPPKLKAVALYDNVFLEIVTNSPDPRADLRDLGLPEDWARYAGIFPFQRESPLWNRDFQQQLLRTVGYRRLARFYARHPDRLGERFRRAARRATSLRPLQLGNFPPDSGAKPFEQSRAFGVWSRWKARVSPDASRLLSIFWLANFVGAVWVWRRSNLPRTRCLALSLAVLALMAATEFGVSVLADSLGDVERHLLTFNAMTDLAVAANAAVLVGLAAGFLRARLLGGATAG
jgi:4-amino-4-deoxy-L-arabinose transferase-like glycosyltransferase